MSFVRSLFVYCSVVAGFSAAAHAQFGAKLESVAVTEFMTQPIGERDGRTWIELYNFGAEPVDLKGFQISDMKSELCEIPEVTIKPGDYVIVVLGNDYRRLAEDRKKVFEIEWLGGKEDPRVVGIEGKFNLAVGGGAIVVNNRRRTPTWILGYRNDGKAGMSTYLAMDKFDVRHYGTREAPSINRNGPDGTVLGYEGQHAKKEEAAYSSDVAKIEEIAGYLYKAKTAGGDNEPSVGSPLKGNYPKP